jgi:FixJ family two-component response regulator
MAEQHLNGSEIFVVDDDELMRDTLSAVFAPEGRRVTSFAEGQPFLVAARTPACILLDVNMPGAPASICCASLTHRIIRRRS